MNTIKNIKLMIDELSSTVINIKLLEKDLVIDILELNAEKEKLYGIVNQLQIEARFM